MDCFKEIRLLFRLEFAFKTVFKTVFKTMFEKFKRYVIKTCHFEKLQSLKRETF